MTARVFVRPTLMILQSRAKPGETDRKILRILADRGRPIGLRSLSDLLDEKPETVARVYEPHLFREGWIVRTLRGRMAAEKARRKFGTRGSDSARSATPRAAGPALALRV